MWKKKVTNILKSKLGRSNKGKILVRHKENGAKKRQRFLDYSLTNNSYVKIATHKNIKSNNKIMLVLEDSKYLKLRISHEGSESGRTIFSFDSNNINKGSDLLLKDIPLGSEIYSLRYKSSHKPSFLRSAGVFGKLIKKEKNKVYIKMSSGIMKSFSNECIATVGRSDFSEYKLIDWKKAGVSRLKGIRPHVRGVAKNPVDHPHGGGEGKTSGGRPSVSPWGWLTKGKRTTKHKKIYSI